MLTPGPTVTFAVATLPSESVTLTTSVTFGVLPAVYTPVPGAIVPPLGFADKSARTASGCVLTMPRRASSGCRAADFFAALAGERFFEGG